MPTQTDTYPRPKRILVIGGGPSGLGALHNLTKLGDFEKVELVERRDDVGGVWHLDPPFPNDSVDTTRKKWPSPAYKGMIGNVLPKYLSFSSSPFPPRSDTKQPFPTLKETHDFLASFVAPLSSSIRLNTEVLKVEEKEVGWKVVLRDVVTEEVKEEQWDAVVVAVGWYDHPVWPHTKGLDLLREKGKARHAKIWTGPEGYEGKRVLVIGNANSSNDIAAHLAPVVSAPVYQSIRRPAYPGFQFLPDERIEMVSPVKEYALQDDGKVEVLLSDGRKIDAVDEVILGTGYRSFPGFVHVFERSSEGDTSASEADSIAKRVLKPIISSATAPHRIPHLHNLILHAYNPTLAFIGSPMAYTPFTIFDLQSIWLALCWTSIKPINYPPSPASRLEFEKARLEKLEDIKKGVENPTSFLVYDVLGPGEEEYAELLRGEVVTVRPEMAEVLPVWNEESRTVREGMFKTKFEALKWARDGEGENR